MKDYLSILKEGAKAWNDWREKEGEKISFINLERADLAGADLQGANLQEVNLKYANLENANLFKADLLGANLSHANLQQAFISNTNFSGTILQETDFTLSYIDTSNFLAASIKNANFTGAKFSFNTLAFCDLSNCIGLEEIVHRSPSIIDVKAISFDYDNLPIKFLAGCGLHKWEIESVKLGNPKVDKDQLIAIMEKTEQLRKASSGKPHSLFISYSTKDMEFVEQLEAVLDQKDIRSWRDVNDMKAGPLEKQIMSAIELNPIFLLILSQNSLDSDWVEFETRKARELEKKIGRHVLCPIALDDSWKSAPWPQRLMYRVQEYNIVDFSDWENEAEFGKNVGKLLEGLEAYYLGN